MYLHKNIIQLHINRNIVFRNKILYSTPKYNSVTYRLKYCIPQQNLIV